MARKLDPKIAEVLKADGFGPDAAWDCHGTWVVYHRVLEQIAAKRRIKFDQPYIVEANGQAKTVAICVTGSLADRTEWSIGEAAPQNNKNAYPYAMAEKRAKDRVILKLIGLAGFAYSEDEADDFKAAKPAEPQAEAGADTRALTKKFAERAKACTTPLQLDAVLNDAAGSDISQAQLNWLKDSVVEPRRAEISKGAQAA